MQSWLLYLFFLFIVLNAVFNSITLNNLNNRGIDVGLYESPGGSGDVNSSMSKSVNHSFRWKLHHPDTFKEEKVHYNPTNTSLAELSSSSLSSTSDLWGTDTTTYFDQGTWGSCTAFAMKYALKLYAKATTYTPNEISAAFIYAESRKYAHLNVASDSGSTNAATAFIVQNVGVISEDQMPYWACNIFKNPSVLLGSSLGSPSNKVTFTRFNFARTPELNLTNLKTLLNVKPIIVAILMYNSSLTNAVMVSGQIPMPSAADLKSGPAGAHAVCISGYTDTSFIFRNSWGTDVGIKGSFFLPYKYLTSLNAKGLMSYVSDAWYYV